MSWRTKDFQKKKFLKRQIQSETHWKNGRDNSYIANPRCNESTIASNSNVLNTIPMLCDFIWNLVNKSPNVDDAENRLSRAKSVQLLACYKRANKSLDPVNVNRFRFAVGSDSSRFETSRKKPDSAFLAELKTVGERIQSLCAERVSHRIRPTLPSCRNNGVPRARRRLRQIYRNFASTFPLP